MSRENAFRLLIYTSLINLLFPNVYPHTPVFIRTGKRRYFWKYFLPLNAPVTNVSFKAALVQYISIYCTVPATSQQTKLATSW